MSVDERLRIVRERVADAAVRSGRSGEAVRLVGVSKSVAAPQVAEAVLAGLVDIGENRVQEAADKIPEVLRLVPQTPTWHLVGHLQTNKAKAAVRLFDTVQSVDSVRLAERLSQTADRTIRVLLEVQFVRAADRFGFELDEVAEALDRIGALQNIDVRGLMTVAPLGLAPEETRGVFRALREKRDRIQEARPGLAPLELSMGMTDDYPIAIEEGATIVRIGRAIFAD